MAKKLAVVMDPIESINIQKDSTFAMLLEAQKRAWEVHYIHPGSIYTIQGKPQAKTSPLRLEDNSADWYELGSVKDNPLIDFSVILMRKDPPFDMEYIYLTYALELTQDAGTMVINNPVALRDFNEKFSIMNFPQCCPPSLVTRHANTLHEFISEHKEVILKPLDAMGGKSILKVNYSDNNVTSAIDEITQQGTTTIMAQQFIPEITHGDKRILIINGDPVPFALARIPQEGQFLGNLAAGGRGVGKPLDQRDRWICSQIKEHLINNRIVFAGIDVIGSYLTEINITSPTCIRELDKQFNLNISSTLFDYIEAQCA
ncbi:MAG: glutathione synthase [Pseudomonadota bacterium]